MQETVMSIVTYASQFCADGCLNVIWKDNLITHSFVQYIGQIRIIVERR